MSKLQFTTKHLNESQVDRKWFIIDATNQTVGRLCAKIATILRGKNKVTFSPHIDAGDYVIVINASKVTFTGDKMETKKYLNFTGYPGGKKEELAKNLLQRKPQDIIERGVKGMLPKNRLGRRMYKKLFVYGNDVHSHQNHKPETLILNK